MKNLPPELLQKMIVEAGTNPAALALAIGRDKDYVRDFIKGRKKSLKAGDLEKIVEKLAQVSNGHLPDLLGIAQSAIEAQPAPSFGLRVEGVVQAGVFIDTSLIEDNPDERRIIPTSPDPRYPHAHQYALEVAGDSMNNFIQDGGIVTCAAWADTGLILRPRMILHVERNDGGRVETTLKRYAERDGKRWLDPDSSNPKHCPIEINGDEATEILIKGLVIGKWEPVDF